MPSTIPADIDLIGTTAGSVWHVLNAQGPITIAKLVKETGAPRDTVMQGLGWLAREGKIAYFDGARSKRVGLASHNGEG
jgi:hypothetical protein